MRSHDGCSPQLPEVGDPSQWRTRPVMLRVACGDRAGAQEGFNDPASAFTIETNNFAGKMYFRFRNCAGEPTEYFSGKNRQLSCVVQGRFKEPIAMSDCYTGYEFEKPFQNVPARWLVSGALRFVRKLAPTLMEDVLGNRPYMLNPLFQTVQLLDVSLPGKEPQITAHCVPESTALLGGIFGQRPLDRIERKKYFASIRNGERHILRTDLVYTMEFYEDKV